MEHQYFNVYLELDRVEVDSIIQSALATKQKGYVCSLESNNVTIANQDPEFLKVINKALVNICDGSVLALILRIIYKGKILPYVGADLFIKYVSLCRYKQYFLGNTSEVLEGLKKKLSTIDPSISQMTFETLPFMDVMEFDYTSIANKINGVKPDIIWVSLGAPKQELFMSHLLPFIDQGIMFGFGAIFNFYSGVGKIRRAPKFMRMICLEWLFRAFNEPRKNIPRYWNAIKVMPGLIVKELKKKRT